MDVSRIKDLAIAMISDAAVNATKENAFADLEYIRGIIDLVDVITEAIEKDGT